MATLLTSIECCGIGVQKGDSSSLEARGTPHDTASRLSRLPAAQDPQTSPHHLKGCVPNYTSYHPERWNAGTK
jgi:hypothetical protein